MATLDWSASMPYDIVNIHDQTVVNDASVIAPVDTETRLGDPLLFMPFVSPKGYGEDNKLVYLNAAAIARYGTPNLAKYGLSHYLVRQWINGGGNVLGMRLAPDDAQSANVALYALIKLEEFKYFTTRIDPIKGDSVYVPYWYECYSEGQHAGEAKENAVAMALDKVYCDADGVVTATTVTGSGYGVDGDWLTTGTGSDVKKVYVRVKSDTLKSKIVAVSVNNKIDSVKEVFNSKSPKAASYFSDDSSEVGNIAHIESVASTYNPNLGRDTKVIVPDTMYYVPLALFYIKPSGSGNYNITISSNAAQESYAASVGEPDRYYTLSVNDGSASYENNMTFSFTPAIYLTESMQLEDVVGTYANNVGVVNGDIDGFMAALAYVTNAFRISDNDPIYPEEIDILNGTDRNGYPISIYRTETGTLNLADPLYLKYGSLGSFDTPDTPNATVSTRRNAIEDEFVDAFKGDKDDRVFDMVRYPFRFIMQPAVYTPNDNTSMMGCSGKVIGAMLSLLAERDNTCGRFCVMDDAKQYQTSRTAFETLKAAYSGISHYQCTVYCNHGMVTDPYTGKKVDMPAVYFDAKALPRSIISGGFGAPLAGDNSDATYYWDDHIRGTLLPRSTKKTELILNHNSKINTMIEESNGRAYSYEQLTAQYVTSSLSEQNNAITLAKIIQYCYDLAKTRRWSDISDPTEVASYAADLKSIIDTAIGDAYASLNITAVPESTNGTGANRIHCILQVHFNDRLKGVTYDIYII